MLQILADLRLAYPALPLLKLLEYKLLDIEQTTK